MSDDQRTYWDGMAEHGADAAVIDPADQRGNKNRYIRSIRDARIAQMLGQLSSEAQVLDYGCGAGHICRLVESLGFDVVGVDISSELLELAKQITTAPTLLIDGKTMPFPAQTFDAALTYVVLGHVIDEDDLANVLAEIARVLKPGSRLLAIEQVSRRDRLVDGGMKKQRTIESYVGSFEAAGMKVATIDLIRTGHFPLIYPIRGGLVPDRLFGPLARMERWYARTPMAAVDYRDAAFECVLPGGL